MYNISYLFTNHSLKEILLNITITKHRYCAEYMYSFNTIHGFKSTIGNLDL